MILGIIAIVALFILLAGYLAVFGMASGPTTYREIDQ